MLKQTGWMGLALVGLLAGGQVMAESRVQIVHAAPFAEALEETAVSVTANGETVLDDFRFGEFTDYLELPAGDYELAVTPAGAADPAITASVTLEPGSDYTVIATGDGINQDLELLALLDDAEAPGAGNLNLRIVHAAPFDASLEETEVSIRLASGEIVGGLEAVAYGADSGFLEIPAGEYDLKVASPDGLQNLIDPLPVDLPEGIDITVVAIGNAQTQPLGLLALPVGELELRTPVDSSVFGQWSAESTAAREGLFLEPVPRQNRLVGTIYTYIDDEPYWLTLDSCAGPALNGEEEDDDLCPNPGGFDGRSATGNVHAFAGGTLGGDTGSVGDVAGTFEIDFEDCRNGNFAISLDDGPTVEWGLRKITRTLPCSLD